MSAFHQKNKSFDFLKQNAIYFVLLILLGIIIAQDPTFLNVRNFSNILTQSSVRLIIALGVAGLLITQVPDLSAGRQSRFSSGYFCDSFTVNGKHEPCVP